MKVFRSVALILAFAAAPLSAQATGSQPNLILSLFGGVAAGHSLWSVQQQPLCVFGPPSGGVFQCSGNYDTLRLTREVTSSIVAGAAATYFPSPHFGYQLELYYLGQSYEDHCSAERFDTTDVNQINQQACNSITSSAPSSGAIGFFGGILYRLAPTAVVSPYIRGGIGILAYSGGTIAMSGDAVVDTAIYNRPVYVDDSPKTTSLSFQFGVGMTVRTSPGYQLRMELRDALADLAYVTGPSPGDNLVPPTATKWFHNIVLTVGLDVVLEQKRGKRY
jgi:hypothetical protein